MNDELTTENKLKNCVVYKWMEKFVYDDEEIFLYLWGSALFELYSAETCSYLFRFL